MAMKVKEEINNPLDFAKLTHSPLYKESFFLRLKGKPLREGEELILISLFLFTLCSLTIKNNWFKIGNSLIINVSE